MKNREPLVLAIYANARGFGFALFEGVAAPIDWGIKTVGGENKTEQSFQKVSELIKQFSPAVLVLQDCMDGVSRCSHRTIRLVTDIATLAKRENIKVKRYSRSDIRLCFSPYGAKNKDDIARTIATIFPEFEPYIPPSRTIWSSERYQMGRFDALSLAFTHYARTQQVIH